MKRKKRGRIFLLVILALAAVGAGYFFTASWLDSRPKLEYAYNAGNAAFPAYPAASFAVVSDLHIYDHSLGVSGAAFEETLYSDRKLLLESEELLDLAIGEIIKAGVDFVLVSGDMTKDGELINHLIVAEKLGRLKEAGINAYVIPGNHDVNNPDAVSYSGGATSRVETVSEADFADIYANFGYGGAVMRDPDSLSYVAELTDGLWLLAIDSCRHRENTDETGCITGGNVSQETMDWIVEALLYAQKNEVAVVAMMHHGAVEHWDGQRKLHPKYLIEDYARFGEVLASYGVRIIFTGHYHAQDITRGKYENGGYLYDVETGSLVTAPCPIRFCKIEGNAFKVETKTIVDSFRPGTDFADGANAFVKQTVALEALKTLESYMVKGLDADIISNAVGDAFVAHYYGDEDPNMRPELDKSRLSVWGRFILFMQQYVLDGLWVDLEPADNNASFSLN